MTNYRPITCSAISATAILPLLHGDWSIDCDFDANRSWRHIPLPQQLPWQPQSSLYFTCYVLSPQRRDVNNRRWHPTSHSLLNNHVKLMKQLCHDLYLISRPQTQCATSTFHLRRFQAAVERFAVVASIKSRVDRKFSRTVEDRNEVTRLKISRNLKFLIEFNWLLALNFVIKPSTAYNVWQNESYFCVSYQTASN